MGHCDTAILDSRGSPAASSSLPHSSSIAAQSLGRRFRLRRGVSGKTFVFAWFSAKNRKVAMDWLATCLCPISLFVRCIVTCPKRAIAVCADALLSLFPFQAEFPMRSFIARFRWCFCWLPLLGLFPLAISYGQEGAKADSAATAASADAPSESKAVEPAAAAAALLTTGDIKIMADTLWVMVTAMLVFFMNLGFACVESGMCRAKNCVNILSKNFIVFAVTSIGFLLLGWGIMFGSGNDCIGTSGLWMVGGADNSPATGDAYEGDYKAINWTGVPLWAKFFFQLVFAGTAATIVSGAVAERIKYHTFIVFSFIMAIAHLSGRRPLDLGRRLAGDASGLLRLRRLHGRSTRSAAGRRSPGILVLGPRIGKYGPDGKSQRHSRPQHDGGDDRLLRALVRLVRLQSRQHDGR